MGTPIARNLLQAGHTLSVYNRTLQRAEPFGALGARIAVTPAEAVQDAEAVVTMVSDDGALENVMLGGTIQALRPGAVHVSMSTTSVALSRRLAESHAARGQHYVAAPVFGRPDAAIAKKLFVVAAGAPEQLERCRPLFDAIGQKTYVAGDRPELANALKLAGNFMITAAVETLAEALAFAEKSGLERKQFVDILTDSLFGAPIYRTYGAMLLANTFEPAGFKLALGLKDNRLLLAAAEEAAVPLPMASLIRDRMVMGMAGGLANADWSAIARLSARDAGLD
jgi:3-hydroxyisobutyrate dehydrogenase-like beta-hydroxyacid dehydrogenase